MDRRLLLALVAALAVAACGSAPAAPAPTGTSTPAPQLEPTPAPTDAPSPTDAPTAAAASEPPIALPSTGSFVFTRYDGDRSSLWVSCADLSEARQLPAPSGLDADYGVWSPDGQRIVFNGGRNDPDVNDAVEPWDIYTMDRDGGDIRKLTDATALLGDPVYSPDGKLITYDSTEAGRDGIWVMDADDGGNKRLVAPLPDGLLQDYAPTFSPDGKRIVFLREVDAENEAALWIVNLDGSDLHRLTEPGLYPNVSEWSPDGSRIVFDAFRPGEELSTIWMIDADGQHLTELTPPDPVAAGRDGYSKPTWSDDGSLVYTIHGIHPGPTRLGIAVMRPDGTGLRYVADGSGYEHQPDWTDTPC